MVNVSDRTSSRDTASFSGCGAEQKQRRADGCQRAANARDPSAGGWYHPSSGCNRWQITTIEERARRGLATVATQVSVVWRSSSRPEASGRILPRKWCWSQRWSTWCSSSLHEPWSASRKSSGWLFVSIVTTNWSEEWSGRRDSHPPCCQCLTVPFRCIILSAEASTKRRRLFQRPILNMMPCVGQQKAEEVRRKKSLGAAAASDRWECSIRAFEEKVEGNNPPNRTRLTPTFLYPSHNLDMAVVFEWQVGRPMRVWRGWGGGTSSDRGRHCPDMT